MHTGIMYAQYNILFFFASLLAHATVALGFLSDSVVKNPPAKQETWFRISGSGRTPGEGNGNLLQFSCLGNPMDRGTWWATVHGVSKEPAMTWQLNSNKQPKHCICALWTCLSDLATFLKQCGYLPKLLTYST